MTTTTPLASDSTMNARAAALRALHRPGEPLVLPNVWDAASARAVEAAGFPAVATGSAAVAPTLGYADGEGTPAAEMLGAVARIAGAVAVPVTADVERGYGLSPEELAGRLADGGAVGCNLEDSVPGTGELLDAEEQAAFLAAVRAAADRRADRRTDGHGHGRGHGHCQGLVINARIDTYLHGTGSPSERLAETVRRARRYLDAGADCVYPILAPLDTGTIGELVRRIDGPVNVLFRPGSPSLAELAALGVARVSYGHGLHMAVQAHLEEMLRAVRQGGSPYGA